MTITEKDLLPITAKELKPGYIYWIKQDNGEFHKAIIDLAWYQSSKALEAYKKGLNEFSRAGKLYTRRDKPGQDFRDVA